MQQGYNFILRKINNLGEFTYNEQVMKRILIIILSLLIQIYECLLQGKIFIEISNIFLSLMTWWFQRTYIFQNKMLL